MQNDHNYGISPIDSESKKELATHGKPLLPFAKYNTKLSELLPFYPIHWHEEMEIIKVQQGCGQIFVEGVWYDANVGDIFILRPFAMHSMQKKADDDMELNSIVFNLRLLETDGGDICTLKYFAPLLNDKHSIPCVVRPTDGWHHDFDKSLTKLFDCNLDSQGAELDVKANLYHTFYLIYSNRLIATKPNITEDKRYYTVKLALEYIRANYMNAITIQDIAQHCGYSEFYMMKLFKQFTGQSCVDYANNYRLTIAGKLLMETSDEINDIAYQVGFNNVSYFNRQFKSQYGVTPREFRQQNTQQKKSLD